MRRKPAFTLSPVRPGDRDERSLHRKTLRRMKQDFWALKNNPNHAQRVSEAKKS